MAKKKFFLSKTTYAFGQAWTLHRYFASIAADTQELQMAVLPFLNAMWIKNIDALVATIASFSDRFSAEVYCACIDKIEYYVNGRDFDVQGRFIAAQYFFGAFSYTEKSSELLILNSKLNLLKHSVSDTSQTKRWSTTLKSCLTTVGSVALGILNYLKENPAQALVSALYVQTVVARAIPTATRNNFYQSSFFPSQMRKSLDVSHQQCSDDVMPPDWQRVFQAGFVYPFIKATQGNTYVDPCFKNNIQAIFQVSPYGQVGTYHYLVPDPNCTVQACHYLNTLETMEKLGYYASHAVDVEFNRKYSPWSGTEQFTKCILEFAKAINRKAYFFVYTSPDFWNMYFDLMQCRELSIGGSMPVLWVAEYRVPKPKMVNCWGQRWCRWQTTENGTVPGIKGNVDLDQDNTLDPNCWVSAKPSAPHYFDGVAMFKINRKLQNHTETDCERCSKSIDTEKNFEGRSGNP